MPKPRMTNDDYDSAVQELSTLPEREWVVCRSREEALALLMWIEDNFPED